MREKKLPSQTLPDFQQYLLSRKLVPEKSVTFYAYWANRYLTFSKRLKNANAIPQIEVSSLRYRLVSRRYQIFQPWFRWPASQPTGFSRLCLAH